MNMELDKNKNKIVEERNERRNFVSLVVGGIVSFFGVTFFAISLQISSFGFLLIPSIVLLVLGAILSLMGGLRKW